MRFAHLDGLAEALFEETGDAMFFFDPETAKLIDANSTAQRLMGYSLPELLRLSVKDVLHSANEDAWKRLETASRQTSVFHNEEGYFLKTVKEDVWIPVNVTMARLHLKPKIMGLITARDVRRQHEARTQLRSLENELRRVMDLVSDCLWSAEIDEAGKFRYRYFSPVVERLAGLPGGFFFEGVHRWWSVVHPEDQGRWTKAMARQRAGQSTQEEYRVVWPDGTIRWVRENVQVSRGTADRGVIRLDGVLTDISDRKKVEFAQRDSEDRFKIFMDNSPAVAFLKSADGRYEYVNRPFQMFCQKDAAILLGKSDFDIFPPEVARSLCEHDAAVLQTNQAAQRIETIPSSTGVLHEWLVSRFPFKDNSGRRWLGCVGLDLREQRELEEKLRSI
jgi:PAS domain S-box-containing protein